MVEVELGCGKNKRAGAIGIDCRQVPEADIWMDLDKSDLPFKDSSVDKIYASHVIEHLDYFHIMDEMHRVLKDGGTVEIAVPYFTNHRAHIGEHKTKGFSFAAFEHFKDSNHPMHKFEVTGNKIIFSKKLGIVNKLINLKPLFYERFFCYTLPASELKVELKKRETK